MTANPIRSEIVEEQCPDCDKLTIPDRRAEAACNHCGAPDVLPCSSCIMLDTDKCDWDVSNGCSVFPSRLYRLRPTDVSCLLLSLATMSRVEHISNSRISRLIHLLRWQSDTIKTRWNCCEDGKEPDWSKFTGIEKSMCQAEDKGNETHWSTVNVLTYTPGEKVIYTLYGIKDGCAEALWDFDTKKELDDVAGAVKILHPELDLVDNLFISSDLE